MSVATGANLHFHYCMGEQTGWSLWQEDSKDCGKCGMDKKTADESGCCKDELQQAKLKVDQSLRTLHFESIDVQEKPAQLLVPTIVITQQVLNLPTTFELPPGGKVPLYLFDRNFRI